jgi:hypothetical protein
MGPTHNIPCTTYALRVGQESGACNNRHNKQYVGDGQQSSPTPLVVERVRTKAVQGCSDGQTFVVTHHEHNSQLEIFIANVSYFYFDNPMSGSEVVSFVKEKSKKTWL